VAAAKLKKGEHLKTPNGATAVADGGTVPADHDGWMWDLTVPGNNDHDFYVVVAATAVLVHNCPIYRGSRDQDDDDEPTYQRMKPRSLGSSNQSENSYTDYLAKQYGLDEGQQRSLHDAITGQHMTEDEIEDIAAAIAEGEDY
jgi:hypothetical protein